MEWYEWEQYFQDLYENIDAGLLHLAEETTAPASWSPSATAAFTRLREGLPFAEEIPYALFASLEEQEESPADWYGPMPSGETEEERAASLLTGPADWSVTVVEDPEHGRIHVFYSAWDEHLALYLLADGNLGEFSPV